MSEWVRQLTAYVHLELIENFIRESSGLNLTLGALVIPLVDYISGQRINSIRKWFLIYSLNIVVKRLLMINI